MKTRSECGTPNTKKRKLHQTIFVQPKRHLSRCRRTSCELPFDIQLNIISRLSVKLIFACKSLSKAFKASISEPSFTRMYHDNNYSSSSSSSLNPIFINSSTMTSISTCQSKHINLELVEFQTDAYTNDNPIITKCKTFSLATLPGPRVGNPLPGGCSIWGRCNGLFCLLKRDSHILNLFLTNPLSGEFIKLPNPVVMYDINECSQFMMAYGLGYCHTTERYKVLRMVTKYLGGGVTKYTNETEILTVGVDTKWRSVLDVNIPYNILENYGYNPQSYMVAFRSALHWIVLPIAMLDGFMIVPKCGGRRMHIAAFNMTEEKVYALPIPSKARYRYRLEMGVLMDKLCLWDSRIYKEDIDIWIMDEYGVEGSWTKQFTIIVSRLPHDFLREPFSVLRGHFAVSSISVHDQVILVSNRYRLVFYDLKTNESLMTINLVNDDHKYASNWMPCVPNASYMMPFVPNFVSFRNRQGWIADV